MGQDHSLEGMSTIEEMRDALQASRKILKAIFDSTQSSIFLVDSEYRILFFNKWARDGSKLLYGREMFIGDSLLEYRREGDEAIFEAFKKNFEQAILSNSVVVSEREMHYPPMKFWVRSEYTPVYTEDNKLIGVVLYVQNISDRKVAESRSEFQQYQLDQIAWSQSHETRQPVATLLGLINIIDKETLSGENTKILGMMEETVLKLEAIIRKNVIWANAMGKAE